jgi:hypothetical protein
MEIDIVHDVKYVKHGFNIFYEQYSHPYLIHLL